MTVLSEDDAEVTFFGPDRLRIDYPDRIILVDYTQGDDDPLILEYRR